MTSQRDAFFSRLFTLAKADPNIILCSADMGAPSLDVWRRELPNQYIDCGIAESNAILVACGLAKMGKKVFAYAIAPFVTYRVLEFIRLNVAGMCLPVTLIGVGSGFSYDDSGPTHHCTEDIAMLRTLPNLLIHNITDSVMASAFADISVGLEQPNYIRLDRESYKPIYFNDFEWNEGFSTIGPTEDDAYIISTGNMTKMLDDCQEEYGTTLLDVFRFPINNSILDIIHDAQKIVIVEEHVLQGGLGSAVLELLNDNGLTIPVKRFGIDYSKTGGYCYQYGGREELQKVYGLDKETILKEIKAWLG